MHAHIAEILEASRLAPSRGNAQPWRFVVDGDTVSFAVDDERDRSPMNAGGRAARIAVGAAIESALIRARRMGATIKPQEPRPGALATFTFTGSKRVPDLEQGLARRTTSRREYDARAADDATAAALRDAAPPLETVRAHWFGRERVRVLGPIVEDATLLLYANATTRSARLGDMRFDVRDREDVAHGLPVGALELSSSERIALDEMRRAGGESAVAMGGWKKLAARERRLVESSSGVCFFAAVGDEPMVDVNVGRSLLRAWTEIARRGLVAQPVGCIAEVEAILAHDPTGTFSSAEIDRAAAIRDAQRAAVPSVDRAARIAIALRYGWSPPVPMVTKPGRRTLEESVEDAGDGTLDAKAP